MSGIIILTTATGWTGWIDWTTATATGFLLIETTANPEGEEAISNISIVTS